MFKSKKHLYHVRLRFSDMEESSQMAHFTSWTSLKNAKKILWMERLYENPMAPPDLEEEECVIEIYLPLNDRKKQLTRDENFVSLVDLLELGETDDETETSSEEETEAIEEEKQINKQEMQQNTITLEKTETLDSFDAMLAETEEFKKFQPDSSWRNGPSIKTEKNIEEKSGIPANDECLDTSKSDFYCKQCDAHLNNINLWESHVRGKHHLKNAKKVPGDMEEV